MKEYKSHKIVKAFCIKEIIPPKVKNNGEVIIVAEGDEGSYTGTMEWFNKHKPEVGGYYVVYNDDYASYSPKEAFEEGYAELDDKGKVSQSAPSSSKGTFGWALDILKEGKKVCRSGWNGKKMFIYLQPGSIITKEQGRNEHLKSMEGDIVINSHIDMKTADGSICIGWLASQTDMLADDWEVVK